MQETLRFKIQKKYSELRSSEKKVADYFLERFKDDMNLTLKKLETQIHVSQPTLMRFVKALGFTSFKEFKVALLSESLKRTPSEEVLYGFEITHQQERSELVSHVISTNIKMLEEALKSISTKQLKASIDILIQARKVAIFAVENSLSIAQDLATKLVYLGIDVSFYEDYYMQSLTANNLDKEDVAVGISYSGNSNNTVAMLKMAKQNNAPCIAITNFANSAIESYGDHVLCTSNQQFLYGDAIYSRCTQMALIDMIYMGMIERDYDRFTAQLEKSRKLILKRGLEGGKM